MRWYVNRNGDTQGPVEEFRVAEWVRAGMRDATVRDEAGGKWMPVAQSPFANLLPPDSAALKRRSSAGLTVAVLLALSLGMIWYACNSFKSFSKERDAKSCQKNLAFYEDFCRDWPKNCTEGARKLAKCDP